VTEHAGPETPEPADAPGTSRLRAVLVAALAVAIAGVAIGAQWAFIAPPIRAVVAITHSGERVHDYLGTESEHFFDAPCLLLGLLTLLAVVGSVLVWQWREHRGPAMVIGLSIGMVIAAATASATGAALARLSHGKLNFDTVPLSGKPSVAYVLQAPPVFFSDGPLQVAMTLVWPAAVAALVYALLAAADARDDLGALPAAEHPLRPLPAGPEAPEAAVS
jgi:hypothetical protein